MSCANARLGGALLPNFDIGEMDPLFCTQQGLLQISFGLACILVATYLFFVRGHQSNKNHYPADRNKLIEDDDVDVDDELLESPAMTAGTPTSPPPVAKPPKTTSNVQPAGRVIRALSFASAASARSLIDAAKLACGRSASYSGSVASSEASAIKDELEGNDITASSPGSGCVAAEPEPATHLRLRDRLLTACCVGDEAAIEQLLARGADPNSATSDGDSALQLAVYTLARHGGSDGPLRLLLDRNADVNHQSNGGHTALSIAARWNAATLAVLLLSYGARRDITNDVGATPADVARACGHRQLAADLSNFMEVGTATITALS